MKDHEHRQRSVSDVSSPCHSPSKKIHPRFKCTPPAHSPRHAVLASTTVFLLSDTAPTWVLYKTGVVGHCEWLRRIADNYVVESTTMVHTADVSDKEGSVPIHCLVYQRDDAFHSSAFENSEVVCGMLDCGGNSCFCVRECGELERLHWQCHEFGGMRVLGCQGPRSPFLPGVHPERKSQIVRVTGKTGDGVNDALAFLACF